MYEDNPAVGLYTLPLILWYTMQLVIGTSLVPRLAAFVKNEETRLGVSGNEEIDAGIVIEAENDSKKQVESDVEQAIAVQPAAGPEAAAQTEYGVAMPWVQQTLS